MSYRAVFSSRCKHAFVLSEANVIDCFVVSYELCLHNFFFDVPDSASSVNARGADHVKRSLVPIEACKWSAKFGWLHNFCKIYISCYIGKLAFQCYILRFIANLPYSEIFTRSSNQIGVSPSLSQFKNFKMLTWSGIHIIFVGGYSCSKYVQCSKSPFSSSSLMISTWFVMSSLYEPSARRKFFSCLLLKFIA